MPQLIFFQNHLIIDNLNNYRMDTCFFYWVYIYKISFENYMSKANKSVTDA